MLKYLLSLLLIAPALAGAALPAVTAHSEMLVEKTGADGHVVLQKRKSVVPGDHLVVENSFHNNLSQPITKFVAANPLPQGVAFTGDATAGAEVSVDGGRNFGAITSLKIKDSKGQLRPAQPEDVTNIRWTISSIAPGATSTVKYRGVVR